MSGDYDHDHHAPKPWGPHDWGHGAPHNSFSPLFMSMGIAIFLFGMAQAWSYGTYNPGNIPMILVGLLVVGFSLFIWWRQDISFDGHYEPLATGVPFRGIQIRKVGVWVFLMSEMMVFTSLFSTYMRYRLGIENCGTVFDRGMFDPVTNPTGWQEGVTVTCFEPASHLIASSWWHIAPGAINTFALIISSYTIVLALKTAKDSDWKPSENKLLKSLFPTRQLAVRNYLIITLMLGSLFIVLKLIEWSHLVAEGFDIGTQAGSIFYIATGAHGLHVFVGLLVMLFLIFKADTVGYSEDNDNAMGIEYFGLYWHFVDLAWVAIFPAFYLY